MDSRQNWRPRNNQVPPYRPLAFRPPPLNNRPPPYRRDPDNRSRPNENRRNDAQTQGSSDSNIPRINTRSSVSQNDTIQNEVNKLSRQLENLKLLAKQDEQISTPSRVCFRCEQRGHLARNCPDQGMGFLAYAHLDEDRLPSTEDKEDWFDNDWEDFGIRQKVIKTIEDAQRLIKTKTESGSTFFVDGIQEHQWIRDLYENIKENVDPSAESTLLADVYAALKRAHDGPTNGRPAKRIPFPVNLPRRDNPDTQAQPENRPPPVNNRPNVQQVPTDNPAVRNYRAFRPVSSRASAVYQGGEAYSIMNQLKSTTARIDFRTLLDIAPKAQQDLLDYLTTARPSVTPVPAANPSNHAASDSQALLSEYTVARAPVEILDTPFEGFIDTRCSHTLASQLVVERLSLMDKMLPPRCSFRTSAGTKETPLGLLPRVPIRIGELEVVLDIHIVKATNYDILLGNDFLHLIYATIKYNKRILQFRLDHQHVASVHISFEANVAVGMFIRAEPIDISVQEESRNLRDRTEWEYAVDLPLASSILRPTQKLRLHPI
jgi:hypothetical protein